MLPDCEGAEEGAVILLFPVCQLPVEKFSGIAMPSRLTSPCNLGQHRLSKGGPMKHFKFPELQATRHLKRRLTVKDC